MTQAGLAILADWQSTTSAIAGLVSAVGVIVAIVAAWIAWNQWKSEEAGRRNSEVEAIDRGWEQLRDVRQRIGSYKSKGELLQTIQAARRDGDRSLEVDLVRIPNFFEDLAFRERRGLISLDQLGERMRVTIAAHWEIWQESVFWMRMISRQPTIYEGFERLADKLKAKQ
jgi:hypothetical protein